MNPITKNVIIYDGLTADVVKEHKFDLLVRGIRNASDFETEHKLAYWNRELSGVATIFMTTPPELSMVSSSAIRELHKHNAQTCRYIDPLVLARWSGFDTTNVINVYYGKCCSGKSTYLKADTNSILIDMDNQFWYFIDVSDEQIECWKEQMHIAFYEKDRKTFNMLTDSVMYHFDWNKIADLRRPNSSIPVVIDFPALGYYWKYIPMSIKSRMVLTKVHTSQHNRIVFSSKRQTNPRLIECSDFFYEEPPFFDKEVLIKGDLK